MDRFKRWLPFLRPLLIVGVFAISLRLLHDVLAHYRYHEVVQYLESVPPEQILLSILLTLAGYFLMDSLSGIALLGLEPTIDFKYHPSWIPFIHWNEPQYPVAPEVEKLRGGKVLCFFGEKEKDSLCRVLDPTLVTIVRERGSHHFAGNYKGIAETILAATAPASSN